MMKYTPEQLEKMSDHEINFAVAERVYPQFSIAETLYFFNPCKCWSDVIPIAEKYKMVIDLEQRSVQILDHSCEFTDVVYKSNNPNPKRAICEVALMIGVEK